MQNYDLEKMIEMYQKDMVQMAQKVKASQGSDTPPAKAVATPTVVTTAVPTKPIATKAATTKPEVTKVPQTATSPTANIPNREVTVNPPQTEVLNQPQKEVIVANPKGETPAIIPENTIIVDEQVGTYKDFTMRNNGVGYLKIQASTANGIIPVQDVNVVVSKLFQDGRRTFYTLKTDANGIVDEISLRTPDKALSQTPLEIQPFSTYQIEVNHPDYIGQVYTKVPIFDGIKSIQPVKLIPNGMEGGVV